MLPVLSSVSSPVELDPEVAVAPAALKLELTLADPRAADEDAVTETDDAEELE